MAMINSRGRLELSPERTKVWAEPKSKKKKKVPVVYYLSRNGHLEHPHFMEVTLSSPDGGLYLKDVINRLDVLRGKGMSSLYSWSSKRGYKNGFVWQDLCEDDFIHPAHGSEYVLKGSEILGFLPPSPPPRYQDSAASSSSSSERALEVNVEYKVYKSELIADAATQTEDKKLRRRRSQADQISDPNHSSDDGVIDREEIEISPPPSSSSPETLESLIKAGGRPIAAGSGDDQDRTVGSCPSGRFRASAVLMQLVSCGSISVKEMEGGRMVTRGGLDSGRKEIGESSFGAMTLEDKEYFSGGSNGTKKDTAAASLTRSNSYNADRSSKLEPAEEEIEAARARCIPRRSKASAAAGGREESASVCRSARGSKRTNDEPSCN